MSTRPSQESSRMQLLSESVEHLEITESKFNKTSLNTLIQIFLQRLKTCHVDGIRILNAKAEIVDDVASNHPLRSLCVDDDELLKFFAGCKQLKSFEKIIGYWYTHDDSF